MTHPHDNPVRAELQSLDQRRADTLADALRPDAAPTGDAVGLTVADLMTYVERRPFSRELVQWLSARDPASSAEDAWRECPRALWLALLAMPLGPQRLTLAAVAVARTALPDVPEPHRAAIARELRARKLGCEDRILDAVELMNATARTGGGEARRGLEAAWSALRAVDRGGASIYTATVHALHAATDEAAREREIVAALQAVVPVDQLLLAIAERNEDRSTEALWRNGYASAQEKFTSERDAARDQLAAVTADAHAAEQERDVATARADAAEAIIAGRTTPPTRAEIDAHFAAGGFFLCQRVGAFDRVAVDAVYNHYMLTRHLDTTEVLRWWACGADATLCAWPVVEGVCRG